MIREHSALTYRNKGAVTDPTGCRGQGYPLFKVRNSDHVCFAFRV